MEKLIRKFWKDEEGGHVVEYALVVGAVSLAALVGAQLLGTNLLAWYNAVAAQVADWTP